MYSEEFIRGGFSFLCIRRDQISNESSSYSLALFFIIKFQSVALNNRLRAMYSNTLNDKIAAQSNMAEVGPPRRFEGGGGERKYLWCT